MIQPLWFGLQCDDVHLQEVQSVEVEILKVVDDQWQ